MHENTPTHLCVEFTIRFCSNGNRPAVAARNNQRKEENACVVADCTDGSVFECTCLCVCSYFSASNTHTHARARAHAHSLSLPLCLTFRAALHRRHACRFSPRMRPFQSRSWQSNTRRGGMVGVGRLLRVMLGNKTTTKQNVGEEGEGEADKLRRQVCWKQSMHKIQQAPHTHTCTHTHAHTCTHMHTHAHTCTHMHTHARTCTHCPLLLQSWPPESYAKHVRSIASYLKTAISEADSVVRATSRKTYWQLHAAFPEVATK